MDVKKRLGVAVSGVTLAVVVAGGAWIGVGVVQGAQAAQARTAAQHEKVVYAAEVHTRVLAQSADIKTANDDAVAKAAAEAKAVADAKAAAQAAALKAAAAAQTLQAAPTDTTAPTDPPATTNLPAGSTMPDVPGTTSPDTTACASGRASTINGVPVCD